MHDSCSKLRMAGQQSDLLRALKRLGFDVAGLGKLSFQVRQSGSLRKLRGVARNGNLRLGPSQDVPVPENSV